MAEKETKTDEKKDELVTTDVFDKGMETVADIAKSITDLKTIKKAKGDDGEDGKDEKDSKKKKGDEEDESEDFTDKAVGASDEIRKGVEVSAFLNDLVEEVGKSINGLTKSVSKGNDAIAKALMDTLEIQKSMIETIKDLSAKVEKFESAPATGRKTILSKGVERFSGADETVGLTKSQIINKLSDLIQKGEAVTLDMSYFESTGKIRNRDVAAKIFTKEVNA